MSVKGNWSLFVAAVLSFLLFLVPGDAGAQSKERLDAVLAEVSVTERLGAAVPMDGSFVNERQEKQSLSGLTGQPILMSFNYVDCPMLCSLQLAGVARLVKKLGGAEGFSVVTISINPREERAQLQRIKGVYVGQAGGTEALGRAWHFLKGEEKDIRAVADAVGFRYRYVAETNEFQHQATLVVLTSDGRVSSYLHGVEYDADKAREALDRARGMQVATKEEQFSLGGFLLNCFRVGADGKAPLALRAMRIGGTGVLAFLIVWMGLSIRREIKRKREQERGNQERT